MSDFDTSSSDFAEVPAYTAEKFGEFFVHIKKINDVFYDQVRIADQKAAYIFTFMLAFLISSSEVRDVFSIERYYSGTLIANVLSAILALTSMLSIVSALLVVLPRRAEVSTSLFWGAWIRHRPLLEEAARKSDMQFLLSEYLSNADVLSAIASQKYRFVGLAFRSLIATVLAYMLLLIAS